MEKQKNNYNVIVVSSVEELKKALLAQIHKGVMVSVTVEVANHE